MMLGIVSRFYDPLIGYMIYIYMIYSRLILPFLQFYTYDFPEQMSSWNGRSESPGLNSGKGSTSEAWTRYRTIYIYMIYIEIIDTSIHDMIYVVIYINMI